MVSVRKDSQHITKHQFKTSWSRFTCVWICGLCWLWLQIAFLPTAAVWNVYNDVLKQTFMHSVYLEHKTTKLDIFFRTFYFEFFASRRLFLLVQLRTKSNQPGDKFHWGNLSCRKESCDFPSSCRHVRFYLDLSVGQRTAQNFRKTEIGAQARAGLFCSEVFLGSGQLKAGKQRSLPFVDLPVHLLD